MKLLDKRVVFFFGLTWFICTALVVAGIFLVIAILAGPEYEIDLLDIASGAALVGFVWAAWLMDMFFNVKGIEMNPILMRLMGKVRCKRCNDRRFVTYWWKQNGNFVERKMACPECGNNKLEPVTVTFTPKTEE